MLAQRTPAHLWLDAMRRADFAAAWAVSDAVLAARDPATCDDPARPYHERWVWDGTPVDGRRVLVRCYHGLGDTLQFARYLAPLRARAAHVMLEVQADLLALLRHVPGPDALHPFDPARPLPPAACTLEIMELAHVLRLAPDSAPYLLVAATPGPPGRVGLCWQAGGWSPARSLDVAALAPLADLPGLRLVSLQRGPAAAHANRLGAADPLEGSMDLPAVARLVAGLDVVVTVDTMVAHLAGALGRPTLLMLKHDPDWRWQAARPVWYASMRRFVQPRPGAWSPVVERVVQHLIETFSVAKGS